MATPAWSAQITDVRIGRHAAFTRVVFELDVLAGYRAAPDDTCYLQLVVDAGMDVDRLRNAWFHGA